MYVPVSIVFHPHAIVEIKVKLILLGIWQCLVSWLPECVCELLFFLFIYQCEVYPDGPQSWWDKFQDKHLRTDNEGMPIFNIIGRRFVKPTPLPPNTAQDFKILYQQFNLFHTVFEMFSQKVSHYIVNSDSQKV